MFQRLFLIHLSFLLLLSITPSTGIMFLICTKHWAKPDPPPCIDRNCGLMYNHYEALVRSHVGLKWNVTLGQVNNVYTNNPNTNCARLEALNCTLRMVIDKHLCQESVRQELFVNIQEAIDALSTYYWLMNDQHQHGYDLTVVLVEEHISGRCAQSFGPCEQVVVTNTDLPPDIAIANQAAIRQADLWRILRLAIIVLLVLVIIGEVVWLLVFCFDR